MASYNTSANVVLTLNGRQAQNMLQNLQSQATILQNKIEKAVKAGDKASAKKFQRELNSVNKSMDQLKGSSAKVEQVLNRLDKASPKELKKALKDLKLQLNGIERGSEAWDRHVAKIKAIKSEIQRVNMAMAEQKSLWTRMNSWLNSCQTAIIAIGAAITGLVMAGRKAVNEFASMEEQLANTRKYTGLTEEDVTKLNEVFKKMDTRTPREKLNELAQEAGRLGMNTLESVQGYVEAADIINVALVDLGDGATQTIAKLTNIFGVQDLLGTKDAMLAVGSTVNVLSQNCTASKPYLVEFAQRMAGIGSQAGLTIPQILAFGAVLDANGQKVEMSATAIQKVIMNLANKNHEFAATLGLDAQLLNETLKHSAKDGLLMFLEALQKMGQDVGFENATMTLAPAFKEMGLDAARVSQVLSTLAMHLDEVKWQMGEAEKAFNEASSATKEYEIFNNTAQASIDKAKKRVTELSVELGEKLYPIMKHIYTSSGIFLRALNQLVSFIVANKREIALLVIAIGAYVVAANYAAIKTAALNSLMKIKTVTINTLKGALYLLQLAYFKVTANTEKATVAMANFNRVSKANPWGMIASLAVVAAGAIYSFVKSTDEATEAEKQAAKEAEEFEKSLTDLGETSARYAEKELTQLDMLYRAATDERIAREDRILAVQKMQALYPDVFKNMSAEEIMLGNAKKAYEDLRDAILQTAKVKAASDKIAQNSELLVGYEMTLDDLEEKKKKLKEQVSSSSSDYAEMRNTIRERIKKDVNLDYYNQEKRLQNPENYWYEYANSNDERTKFGKIIGSRQRYASELAAVNKEIVKNNEAWKKVNDANEKLYEKYGISNLMKTTEENEVVIDYDYNEPIELPKTGAIEDKFKAEKEWREKEEALSRISYATGQSSLIEHTNRMLEIEKKFYNKQLEHTDLSENERLKIIAQLKEAELKLSDEKNKQSVESENQRYAASIAELKQFYIDGQISKETYDLKIEEAEIEHQNNLVNITKAGSSERAQAETRLQDLQMAQMQRRQQEAEELKKKYDDIKKEYFGDNAEESKAKMDSALADLEIVYQNELLAAGDNAAEKLRIEEAYQHARLAIIKKYSGEGEKENKNAIAQFAEWLDSDGGKAVTGAMGTMVSGMSAIFSQLNSLMQADLEMQTAKIEKKYNREIELAEGNSYRVAALEKKKEKEIAKAKNEANKKMFAMQVIQAVAQTAQNALSAYGSAAAVPVIGYILAPIAAAMAVAAGAIQIAAIKKQQQASEAQGYAEGGFTPAGNKYQEVGVVHAGEWVASQELVNNPQTRPILEALDYAQRNNSIGSIRMRDVSRTVSPQFAYQGSPSAPGFGGMNVITVESEQQKAMMIALGNTIEALNKRLNEPFAAIATVAGDYGINKAQADYSQLLKNKSPKFRK